MSDSVGASDGVAEDTALMGLVRTLRAAGFVVGASELVDAGRLLRYLADGSRLPPLDELCAKLRPIFCKSRDDQARFDRAFDGWAKTRDSGQAQGTVDSTTSPAESATNEVTGHHRRRVLRVLGIIVLLAACAIAMIAYYWPPPAPPPVVTTSGSNATAPGRWPALVNLVPPLERHIDAYYPAYGYNRELRPVWAWGALAIPLTLLVGVTLPAILIARGRARRGDRRVQLDNGPLRNEARRIVPPLAGDIAALLERHVRADASAHGTLARRAPIHLRRSVEATLRNLGVPQMRYRHTHLRPSYLLLIDVEGEDDPSGRLFYVWASRLRTEGLHVDIRQFIRSKNAAEAPAWFPSSAQLVRDRGRAGRPLDRLEDPPVGQRLIVVSNAEPFADESGRWQAWAQRARFYRWRERVVFTPTEPREWGAREESLERPQRAADPGFLVLPLDEDALRAWSKLLASGELPEIVLTDPQRYPRLLFEGKEDVLSDDPNERIIDPLIAQLKLYLGENGFQWLAACAVAPIVRWELTLLLGERLFRLGGVEHESELRYLIARNYRRLSRLPWLRAQRLPDWLRLRLLAELSDEVQARIRDVVRGLLDPLTPQTGPGLVLDIEPPPGRERNRAGEPGSGDALYLGYMSGLTARQLAMRAPASWSKWLNRIRFARPAGMPGWRHYRRVVADVLGGLWARLAFRDGIAYGGARRTFWLFGGALILWAALVGVLGLTEIGTQTHRLNSFLFAEEPHRVGYGHRGPVRSATFSPDGAYVLTASDDGTARLWDAATGKPVGRPMQHGGPVNTAAFNADGRQVVTASSDATARIWHAATGRQLVQFNGHRAAVNAATFNPSSTLVATASDDGTAVLWDASGSGEKTQLGDESSYPVNSVAFSPDGRRVVTASDDATARLWDAASGKPLGVPMRHAGRVESAVFSPDGTRVATASADRTARLWDAFTGKQQAQLDGHISVVNSAVFSPDGTLVVTASADRTARVWDAATGKQVAELIGHRGSVYSAIFSPDRARVLTASADHTARLWDAATGTPLGMPMMQDGPIYSASFARDGARVVTGSADQTALLWGADVQQPAGDPRFRRQPLAALALGWITAHERESRAVLLGFIMVVAWIFDYRLGRRLRREIVIQHRDRS
ncbi:WD40 repeat domain-containing protein [Paraburkholderia elongata]|uniref:WD40 repeat domain-containing protein n=1 Tax=Paraburkholderia elongata TaxID=2675747 RepID=A0A972NNF4_9BURK|nr:WD40 repeat domain-containing protein [Paraburkholderia elongata]NPT56733.1 hypothetical protein [Paraburkholderia elongata]